jgi:two-component system cell cycle response regulator
LGPLSISLGVALFPDHGAEAHAIVEAADRALLRAKSKGRDRVELAERATERGVFTPDESAEA